MDFTAADQPVQSPLERVLERRPRGDFAADALRKILAEHIGEAGTCQTVFRPYLRGRVGNISSLFPQAAKPLGKRRDVRVSVRAQCALFNQTRAVRLFPNNRDQAVARVAVSVVFHIDRAGFRFCLSLGPAGEKRIRKARVEPVATHFVILCADIDRDIGREAVGRYHAGQFALFRKAPLRVDRIRQVFERLREVEKALPALRGDVRGERLIAQRVLAELLPRKGADAVGIFRSDKERAAGRKQFPRGGNCRRSLAPQGSVKENVVKRPGEYRALRTEFSGHCLKFSRQPKGLFSLPQKGERCLIRVERRNLKAFPKKQGQETAVTRTGK